MKSSLLRARWGVACVTGIKAGEGEKGKKLGGNKGEGIGERRKGSHAEKHAPNSDWSLKCQLG